MTFDDVNYEEFEKIQNSTRKKPTLFPKDLMLSYANILEM